MTDQEWAKVMKIYDRGEKTYKKTQAQTNNGIGRGLFMLACHPLLYAALFFLLAM